MSFLAKLFDPGEKPLGTVDDPQLGVMAWSNDEEAWIGTCNELRFVLAYERKAAPTAPLLSYAKEMLGDPGRLARALEDEKKVWASKVPPAVKGEVAALSYGLVSLSMQKGRGYIIADVEGGGDNRSWRIEFIGNKCGGLGFDT